MRRKLILIGVIAALSAGGLGGVLATALCAHAGAAAAAREHSCCPEEGGDEGASCPMSAGRKSAARAHGSAGAGTRRVAVREARAAAEEGRARIFRPVPCAHCVGTPSTPPAAFKLGGADAQKRGDEDRAPRATLQRPDALNSFAPSVTPTQGAPPTPATRRHVLNSVFLI